MLRIMLKSKIHRATVTDANLNYEGSLTIDKALMEEAGLYSFEKIEVYNISNGERFNTYVIEGEKNLGIICVNGAAARRVAIGDLIIIVSYALFSEDEVMKLQPRLVNVDANNRIKR